MKEDEKFDLEVFEKSIKDSDWYPIEECCKHIESIMEDSIIRLYDSVDRYLFQDIDYGMVISALPQWVADAGVSPELKCSKDFYENLRKSTTHPIFGRFLYYYDLWGKIAAIQDRYTAVMLYMRQFYKSIPCRLKYSEEQYTSRTRCGSMQATEFHMLLNGIFVAYASIFDLLAKIAVEEYEYEKYDFSQYKKMRSANVTFKRSLPNIDVSLKIEGLLFCNATVINKIVTFRNEYVHNGPWDLRSSVYETMVSDEMGDVIIYSPDMDEMGNFVSSGSRNRFYSQANRINEQLPGMIMEANQIVQNTIEQISRLYQKKTFEHDKKSYTEECIKAITA